MRLSLHNQAAQDLPPVIVESKALLMITQMETFFGSPKSNFSDVSTRWLVKHK